MRICVAFLLVLLFLSCVPVQAEINPSVDTKPFFCRYTLTDWTPLCPAVGTGGAGSGSTFVNSENNTFYYNTTTNETYVISNQTSFFNTTIGNNLTTFSNYTYWYITNITQSEMNQTPGPQGPQGIQGPQGVNGTPGINGTPGAQGIQGIQGINGADGAQGIQGEKGDKGDKGDTGATGATGPAGADGAANMTAGPQGEQGEKGDKGDKGDTGDTGPVGSMNMTPNMTAGPAGATGATGPAGLDANVSTMYPNKSVYFTTNTSNPSTILNFGTWSLINNIPAVIPAYPISTCSASSSYTACSRAYDNSIVDNDLYRWVASGGAPQWVQVDLGATKTINTVNIFGYNSGTQTYVINTSTDGSVGTTMFSAVTPGTNTWSNRTTSDTSARYVRIIATSSSGWSSLGEVVVINSTGMTPAIYGWERIA